MTTATQEVRSFNRFYTVRAGLLRRSFLGSGYSLPEARVLFELGAGDVGTAADLVRRLSMDKGQVSRIVERFRAGGLVVGRPSADHARRILLSLTEAGRAAFAEIDAQQEADVEAMIAPLGPEAAGRLSASLRTAQRLLAEPKKDVGAAFELRGLHTGELGLVVSRQAAVYAEEQGWGLPFEVEVARIAAECLQRSDSARDGVWIAERDGAIAGSVFLTSSDDPAVGRLRLLYVEPFARGVGIGAALTSACVERARASGYRRLELWTHAVLEAAGRIYRRAGFRLVREEAHTTFGPELAGQFYALDL